MLGQCLITALRCQHFVAAVFFSVFDMENGYLQGEMDEAGTSVFAITTEDGVYGPLRVPYGVKNAPRWFHNAVAEIVHGLDGTESVFRRRCHWSTHIRVACGEDRCFLASHA